MNNRQEYIVAAAYKLSQNNTPEAKRLIYKNAKLWKEEGVPEYDDIYDIRIARHHAEILSIYLGEIDQHTDGFYTSWGRWVDRYDAAKIAITCGQCEEGKLIMGKRLDSSDVFK